MLLTKSEIANLKEEIKRLTAERIAERERATFLGMTPDQVRAHEEKRVAIAELNNKLLSAIDASGEREAKVLDCPDADETPS